MKKILVMALTSSLAVALYTGCAPDKRNANPGTVKPGAPAATNQNNQQTNQPAQPPSTQPIAGDPNGTAASTNPGNTGAIAAPIPNPIPSTGGTNGGNNGTTPVVAAPAPPPPAPAPAVVGPKVTGISVDRLKAKGEEEAKVVFSITLDGMADPIVVSAIGQQTGTAQPLTIESDKPLSDYVNPEASTFTCTSEPEAGPADEKGTTLACGNLAVRVALVNPKDKTKNTVLDISHINSNLKVTREVHLAGQTTVIENDLQAIVNGRIHQTITKVGDKTVGSKTQILIRGYDGTDFDKKYNTPLSKVAASDKTTTISLFGGPGKTKDGKFYELLDPKGDNITSTISTANVVVLVPVKVVGTTGPLLDMVYNVDLDGSHFDASAITEQSKIVPVKVAPPIKPKK